MSSAEITLGAHLYTRAVEENLPDLFNNNSQDYGSLQLAFRDMARWLVKNDCLNKDENGQWQANNAGMDKIGEEDAKAFLPYYQTVVLAHHNADREMIRDGKADYMKEFRELHADTIYEIVPETVTRVRPDDMKLITQRALNLLQAAHDNPAEAVFVPGLEKGPMDTMWSILEQSGYLMPGENPDREAPLGDQSVRGTPEQMDALFHVASEITSNLDLPQSIKAGDVTTANAALFKSAVSSATREEVEVGPGAIQAGWDSDLMKADCNSLYNISASFIRVAHTAQWDTQNPTWLLADRELVDDLKIAIDDYEDKSIDVCLGSGNMGDPKISSKEAVELKKLISEMKFAISPKIREEIFSGDEGSIMTQGGAAKAAARDFQDELGNGYDNAFDNSDGDAGSASKSKEEGGKDEKADNRPKITYDAIDPEDLAATDTGKNTAQAPVSYDADADYRASEYGRSELKVRIPEELVYKIDNRMMELIDNGTVEYFRQRAGRAEAELGDLDSSRAAFGSLEDAMGQYREAFSDPRAAGRAADVITTAQKANMNPARRERLRTAKIEAGRGPFKGYKTGAPDIAAKRMTRWLDDNMLTKEGEPNYDLRRFLRDATQMPVEASNRSEGEALRAYAEKFVERDREEVEKRREAKREDRGLSRVEFSAQDIGHFVDVKEASGTNEQVKMIIGKDGFVSLSDPDAPKLTSPLSETSKSLTEAFESPKDPGREFGGMISVQSLKAAYQTGADKISVLIDGETPYGAIAKMEEEPVRKKAKIQDVVLS